MRTIKISEYPKRDRIKSDKTAPIIFKVKANDTTTTINTNAFANPDRWDATNCFRITAKQGGKLTAYEKETRFYLDSLHKKLESIEDTFIESKEFYSADMMKNKLLNKGTDNNSLMVLDLWSKHEANFKARAKQPKGGLKLTSYQPYNSARKQFKKFLKSEFKTDVMLVKKIDNIFQQKFHTYLQTTIGANTTYKYLTLFRAVFKWGKDNGLITENKLTNIKAKKVKVTKIWLTLDEIKTLAKKKFKSEAMAVVRDYFLFSCYTGYSFADTYNLSLLNIVKEGDDWFLIKNREKTGNKCDVFLIQEARELINKYQDNLFCIARNKLFPILSNQKTNAYLKLIADACEINKVLTYHCARNSFARILAQNGTMTNELQDVLGHSRIQQTKEYIGQMDNSQIKKVMKKMEGVFSSN